MIHNAKMFLAQIEAEKAECKAKAKKEAFNAAINVARVLADKGVLCSMRHSVDDFGEHLGLTLVGPNKLLISIDIRDERTLDVLMQMLKTFYPEMSGVFDQAMREQ